MQTQKSTEIPFFPLIRMVSIEKFDNKLWSSEQGESTVLAGWWECWLYEPLRRYMPERITTHTHSLLHPFYSRNSPCWCSYTLIKWHVEIFFTEALLKVKIEKNPTPLNDQGKEVIKEIMILPSVLVCLWCQNKAPQTARFKQQKCCDSKFRRLEDHEQGVKRAGCSWELWGSVCSMLLI